MRTHFNARSYGAAQFAFWVPLGEQSFRLENKSIFFGRSGDGVPQR